MKADLFLGRRSALLVGAGGGAVSVAASAEASGCDVEDLVREAWKLLPQRRRWTRAPRLTVWLSSAWARPVMVSPVAGLRNWAEVMAWAKAEGQRQVGATWRERAEVWIDHWNEREGSVGVATDLVLIDALRTRARATGWRLAAVRPWWATPGVLEGHGAGAELLMAACDDGVAWLIGDARQVYAAGAWVPRPPGEEVENLQRRLALAHPDAAPRLCQWHENWLQRS